ncbi:MAG: hypothetical protein DWH81_15500 [Planctomycetota bacterium]|nr:MAG: hypothetical protein DWH81_15500 [Planctomycetota bacterium]
MPLYLPGSVVLGPRGSGASAPSSLTAFLASIGKASWYGGFQAGVNMFSATAGGGSSVTTNGANVGSWLPNNTAGGWTAVFNQGSSPKKPMYGTSRNGKPGIFGDADGLHFSFNSTTALNLPHTVLISAWTSQDSGCLYSHNTRTIAYLNGASTDGDPNIYSGGVRNNQVAKALISTPATSTTASIKVGISSTGSAFYNTAPNLFRQSDATAYTNSTIYELWFVPWLTPSEANVALTYLA